MVRFSCSVAFEGYEEYSELSLREDFLYFRDDLRKPAAMLGFLGLAVTRFRPHSAVSRRDAKIKEIQAQIRLIPRQDYPQGHIFVFRTLKLFLRFS